jgi:FkbM family methyltransferase
VKRRFLLVILLLLVALGAAYAYYPPFRLAAWALTGRSPQCPFPNAVRAASFKKENTAIKDRILAASKKIEVDPAGYSLWDTPKGRFWVAAGEGNDWGLPFNLAEQEQNIYGSGEHYIQPGDIVLDCGANVGIFTREALRAGASLVVAIEPAPENLECLRRNLKEEVEAGKVIIYPKGVWHQDDWLQMEVSPDNAAADTFVIKQPGGQPGPRLPLTTIDKLVAELNLPRVDFIKMDIEGAERNALQGARQTLAKHHPRMALCTYHVHDDPVVIPAEVRKGWEGYREACGPCAETEDGIRPDVMYFF